jgi:hypothetical protein
MIRKSGHRFSDKIMLHQESEAQCQIALQPPWMQPIGSDFKVAAGYFGSDTSIACQI